MVSTVGCYRGCLNKKAINMTKKWEEYQNEVADFFRSIGLKAGVEQKITGARGSHKIDVWVTFDKYGQEIRWVVECKLWKSAIPKEKVLTLHQIIQDVGADRGIFLSESGFQAGAIQVAKNTNINLTSLQELRLNINDEIISFELVKAIKRTSMLDEKLQPFIFDDTGRTFPSPGISVEKIISIMTALGTLKLASPKALSGIFPVWIITLEHGTKYFKNAKEFSQDVSLILDKLENDIDAIYLKADGIRKKSFLIFSQLISAVENLIFNAETALFTANENKTKFENNRLKAAASMEKVGMLSDNVRLLSQNDLRVKLYRLMRLLIDTVYLHLTKSTITKTEWENTKNSVENSLDKIRKIVAP